MTSGYLGGIFGCFGALRGAPGVTDGRCAPQEGEGVGRDRKTQHLMILRGLYPSLLMAIALVNLKKCGER